MLEDLSLSELLVGQPRYGSEEIAGKAGVSFESARRIWRAMGFAEPPDDEPFFTDADLHALQTASSLVEAGHADEELIVTMARVLSQSIAQAARAQTEAITARLVADDAEIAPDEVPVVLEHLETLLVHIWKRHLAASLEKEASANGEGRESEPSTVGFADLVGFTRLSRKLSEQELTSLVERFDARTQEIVSEVGGRIVKTIGDEAMFVARDPAIAAEAALRIIEAFPVDDDDGPTVRVGLASGNVVPYRGDVFGPTVNLASRAVGEARPCTVLTSEETRDALSDDDRFAFKPIRTRRLKGVGSTKLWSLRRPSEED